MHKYSGGSNTTSAAYVASVLLTAERLGVERALLCADAGLTPADVQDPLQRVPLAVLNRLMEQASVRTGLDHFGLLCGQSIRTAHFGGLGLAAMTSGRLRDAIGMIGPLGRLVFDHDASRTDMAVEDHRCSLADVPLPGCAYPLGPQLVDAMTAGWVAFGRWMTGRSDPMLAVQLHRPAVVDTHPYQAFFGCTPQYAQPRSAIVFDAALLDTPLLEADSDMHQAVLTQARAQLDRALAPWSLVARVRAVLAEQLPWGAPRLPALCAALQVSPRSLQRQLAQQGQGYAQVLDAVRRERTEHLLRHTDDSMLAVAMQVGYSEAASFSHAFRAWFGCSPQQYRQRVRSQAPGVPGQGADRLL
jgi:AraC-like DNA-binding protein